SANFRETLDRDERCAGSGTPGGRGDPARRQVMDRIKMLRRVLALVGARVERRLVAELEYLREENRVLERLLGDRRPPLTDAERIRLAVKAKALARDVLERIATIAKPKTLRDWHRRLVERRAASPRPARRVAGERLRELVLRFAKENPGWGCRRIQGALANLGVHVGDRTVARILAREDVAPPPTRPTSWRTFICAEAEVLAAADFFTVPVWTIRGIVAHHVLFVIDIGTRAVEILGVTTRPNARFVEQVGRRLVDRARGFLRGKRWLVIDRDRKFTFGFRRIFARTGIEVIRTAPRAPNMNA